jgi:inosose dehydratase
VRAREQGDDYRRATVTQHVWTELGRGDVDFGAVFAAVPSSYDGWFVAEVDVPDADRAALTSGPPRLPHDA